MKRQFLLILCIIGIFFTMVACQQNEEAGRLEEYEKQEINVTCEIVENSEPFCDKAVKAGIYTEYSKWEKAIEKTDVEVILERADMYDEAFFEDKALIYLVDCSSGGGQYKYEGYETDDAVLYIQISGSTEFLLNKLHAYHVFFVMDKKEAEKLDKAELSIFSRD